MDRVEGANLKLPIVARKIALKQASTFCQCAVHQSSLKVSYYKNTSAKKKYFNKNIFLE